MTITGKVEFISTFEKGTDKNGKDYEKAYFVVNDGQGQYPNKYKIELFNKTDLMKGVKVGSNVTVSVNSNVNEYQGKHYGSLMAYKLETNQQPAQTQTPQPAYDAKPMQPNALPF
jgi:hypothetical protein